MTEVVVVGDAPIPRAVRDALGARRVSERSHSPHRFAGARAVVVAAHLGEFERVVRVKQDQRRAEMADRAERIVLDCHIESVPHIVVISSAMVAGPRADRPLILDDDPAIAVRDGFVSDVTVFETAFLAALEALPEQSRPAYTILRAAAVAGPGIDTLVTRHFEAPRVLSLKGVNKHWQFVHISDVARAAARCIEAPVLGFACVGAVREVDGEVVADELSMSEVLSIGHMRGIELGEDLAFSTAARLHRVGVLPAPESDMELAVYPWSVYPEKLLATGWRSRVSTAECVRHVTEETRGKFGVGGRRVGHKDAAALGAAGAAVALISTAALWRQNRR